jgi:hypothetical protein
MTLALMALATVSTSAEVEAVAQRTFVRSTGVDANTALNCSLVNPCRSFSAAMSVTSPGGEVIVLDSAGYGAVTISQAVSIIAPAGIYAGITVNSGNGITVSAGPADVVVLRGLSLNSLGLGASVGIQFISGKSLIVGRTTVTGFSTGIVQLGNTSLFVSDTQIAKGLAGFASSGTSGGVAEYVLDRVTIENVFDTGIFSGQYTVGAVRNSTVANVGNGANGRALAAEVFQSSASAIVTCDQCTLHGSYMGVYIGAAPASLGAIVRLNRSAVSGNFVGVFKAGLGGIEDIRTIGNNLNDGNVNPSAAATAVTPY